MVHRGELLRKAADDTKTKIAALARHLNVSRNQLYNWFTDPQLRLDVLVDAGKYMFYDFGKYIPEIAEKKPTPEELENLEYKFKYLELAEKLIQVMEEKEEYRKELEALKKKK